MTMFPQALGIEELLSLQAPEATYYDEFVAGIPPEESGGDYMLEPVYGPQPMPEGYVPPPAEDYVLIEKRKVPKKYQDDAVSLEDMMGGEEESIEEPIYRSAAYGPPGSALKGMPRRISHADFRLLNRQASKYLKAGNPQMHNELMRWAKWYHQNKLIGAETEY